MDLQCHGQEKAYDFHDQRFRGDGELLYSFTHKFFYALALCQTLCHALGSAGQVSYKKH